VATEGATGVGATANSTGSTLRALEGGSNVAYGAEASPGLLSGAQSVPAADVVNQASTAQLLEAAPTTQAATPSVVDTVAPMAQTATPAAPAQMAAMPDVGTPGGSFNSTGTTLRGMEGGTNATYNGMMGGAQPNGGTTYLDSVSKAWNGMGGNAQGQIIGGGLKGAGMMAAQYYGQKGQIESQRELLAAQQQAKIDEENRIRNNRSNFTPIIWRTK
jgi:hypothetical protein